MSNSTIKRHRPVEMNAIVDANKEETRKGPRSELAWVLALSEERDVVQSHIWPKETSCADGNLAGIEDDQVEVGKCIAADLNPPGEAKSRHAHKRRSTS